MSLDAFNVEVSHYASARDTGGTIVRLVDLVQNIRSGIYREQITALRNESNGEKKSAKKLLLPGVTISGKFSNPRREQNLISHSGFIQIDIDHAPNPKELKEKLKDDPYSFSVFISPSGTGAKVIVKIPAEHKLHRDHFLALEQYYLLKYKVQIDANCKDISRLMFISYDPQLYLNVKSEIFTTHVLTENEVIFVSAISKTNFKKKFEDGRNSYVLSMAAICRNRGLSKDCCIKLSEEYFEEIGFDAKEILGCVTKAYDYGNNNSFEKAGHPGLLKIRTAAQCIQDAMQRPTPERLFGDFWFENEIAILFADTGVGKTVLAVQIANSISKGRAVTGFELSAKKQTVFYVDFELSDKQFEKRYSEDYRNHFEFDDNFYRIEIDSNYTNYDNFEVELYNSLEYSILQKGVKILIVDNITFLRSQSTETAKDALPLMKKLVDLKKKYDLSLLILAHTPKRKDTNQITVNDLAGSKQISNFADSIFSIGVSHKEECCRYLKQLKARSSEKIYDSENVAVFRLEKNSNFLFFEFLEIDAEQNHLKQMSETEKAELDSKILELKKSQPLLSLRQIAGMLVTNPMRVRRVLKRNNIP